MIGRIILFGIGIAIVNDNSKLKQELKAYRSEDKFRKSTKAHVDRLREEISELRARASKALFDEGEFKGLTKEERLDKSSFFEAEANRLTNRIVEMMYETL